MINKGEFEPPKKPQAAIPGFPNSLDLASKVASVVATLVGCIAPGRWQLDMEALKHALHSLNSMRSTTEVAFIFSRASL